MYDYYNNSYLKYIFPGSSISEEVPNDDSRNSYPGL